VETTFLDAGASADKLIVNPFGVDTSFWAVNRGAPISRPFRVIYAASLILRKGIAYLLEAWKQAELRDAQLLLAGSIGDEARPFLKALPDNVVLLGFMEHGRLRETYGDCDLYVLPSLEEGMARSALEAMAAGLPLVVTRETGMTDIMMDGEDGFVVPAMDVDALVHVLRSAADDRGRLPAMGRSAQIRVSRFSWKAYGQRCGDVLKGLIGSPAAVNRLHA
jgi:glycosyltransferase involved in cell wall biosynthesis